MSDYRETCPCDICAEWRDRQPKAAEVKVEAPKEVPTSRVLTREMVLRGRPCGEFRKRFLNRFLETVEVTVELAVSQASDWDWWWAVANLLSADSYQEARKSFNEAERVHDAELAPYAVLMEEAYKQYYAVRNAAQIEAVDLGLGYYERYDFVNAKAEKVLEMPQAARDAAAAIAEKRFHEAQAKAWAELFLADGEAYAEQHKNNGPFVDTWVEEIQDYDVYGTYDNEEEDEDY